VAPTDDWLASRGWFDGDETELTLELVDARSGVVSWHRTVRSSADPRDAGAVAALLDPAVADQPFGRREAAPEAPQATPKSAGPGVESGDFQGQRP
jgi:hypothetical protein